MLVLVRKVGEEIVLQDDSMKEPIRIRLNAIVNDHTACIGIQANKIIRISRAEILKARKSVPHYIKKDRK